MRTKLNIIFAMSVVILTACEEDAPVRSLDRPSLGTKQPTLKVEKNADRLTYGDTLFIRVMPEDTALKFSDVRVALAAAAGRVLASSDDGVFRLSTRHTGGGEVKLRIDAEFTDGQKSMRYQDVWVTAADPPLQWRFETVRTYPHEKSAFTQGLLFHKGYLYEGTGNLGESRIREVDLTTGEAVRERENRSDIFGEGITIFDGKVYQLTYKNGQGFIYNLEDFEQIDSFVYNTYTGEGWGLTHNDTALIASDGSAYLHYFDPETMTETGRVRVFDDRGSVTRLNELEYRGGLIYANIYGTFEIVAADAETGRVINRYNARDVLKRADMTAGMDVLNGIAVNPLNGNLLITGKYWKKLYEVRPVPAADS